MVSIPNQKVKCKAGNSLKQPQCILTDNVWGPQELLVVFLFLKKIKDSLSVTHTLPCCPTRVAGTQSQLREIWGKWSTKPQ